MKASVSALWLALAALAVPAAATAQGLRPVAPQLRSVPAEPQAADYIVAVVNTEPITNNEVRMRMARFAQELSQQGQTPPPRQEFMKQVLERLITEKSQLQLAKENSFKAEDAQVDQAEQTIARNNGMTVAELRRRVQADGMQLSQFRDELRDQLTLSRLREREVDIRVRVSDLELDQFIEEQRRLAQDPSNQELNLGHILVPLPENATEAQVAAARDQAMRVVQRARAGEDFAAIALDFREPQSVAVGANGMATGMRPQLRIPPLFTQAIERVPQGAVSEPVRSEAGFHVVKVFERKGGGIPTTVVQVHARHILLRPSPQMNEGQAVQRLAEFKRRLVAKQADFAQLAKDYSQDASAKDGGDLGWASPGTFVPEFEDALASLKAGDVGDPLISRFGVHLIQVLERKQATLTPKEQRDIARNMLRERKTDEAYLVWAQETRGKAYVEYREPPR